MKLNKILSTTLLASALSFTLNVNATDFSYTLKQLIDVNALGIAELGDKQISIKGFNPTFGFIFDTVGTLGGDEITFKSFLDMVDKLESLPVDTVILSAKGKNITAGNIINVFDEMLDKLLAEPQVLAALEAQGYTAEEISQISTKTLSEKVTFFESVNTSVKQIQQVDLLQKVALPVMNSAISQLGSGIEARSDMFNQNEAFGISSGVEMGRGHGVWIKGLGAKEDYKVSGEKYKAKSFAGIVGIDFKVMDELTVGLAGGYQQREFTKQKIKFLNAIGSIYGSYHFDNNAFVDAKYAFARGIIKSKNEDLNFKGTNTVHQADAKLGYNFLVHKNTLLTPTVGIRYNIQMLKPKSDAFGSEYTAKAKNGNYSHAIVGAKLAHKIENTNGALIPFVKVGYENLMSNKKTKINLTNKNTNKTDTVKFDNTEKHTFLAGAGIGAVLNNIDLGAEYTFSKSKLYKGHTGTLALRVNF